MIKMSKKRYFVLQATGQPKQFSVYAGGDSQHPITNRKEAEAFVAERVANVPQGSIIVVHELGVDEDEAPTPRARSTPKTANTSDANTASSSTESANTAS
jgi:hypothetical protein